MSAGRSEWVREGITGAFRVPGCNEHNRSGAGEKRYAALCVGKRVVRGMGLGFSDYHVVMCKVQLVGA